MTVAFTITALLLGIIGAVAAGTGTVAPPPKIAFVTTNANVAPDALTVGPMAGRLGAPLFITNKDALGESTKNALVDYGADLIIVAGGPNTVTDTVLAQIAAATGLAIKQASDTPDTGIIRVSGDGRDETAVALSTLIAAYNPKFLPTDATAADADLLDGLDSTAFLGATAKAADADKLDGKDSSDFLPSLTLLTWNGEASVDFTTGAFSFKQVRTVGDFSKQSADTVIRIDLNSHYIGTGGFFCEYQLRVDGVSAAGNTTPDRTSFIGGADNDRQPLIGSMLFEGLSAGSHSLSLWVRSDSGVCSENDGNHVRQAQVTEYLTN